MTVRKPLHDTLCRLNRNTQLSLRHRLARLRMHKLEIRVVTTEAFESKKLIKRMGFSFLFAFGRRRVVGNSGNLKACSVSRPGA